MISSSPTLVNLKVAHLLWIGSIIFETLFAIKINLQILAVSSIILLSAVWASAVISSASSKIIILKGTFDNPANPENFFTFSLTIPMPLSSDAFNSSRFPSIFSPKICLVIHNAVVVFPTPAEPENIRCGISVGSLIKADKLPIISLCPTISEISFGRYFSTHIPVADIKYQKPDPLINPNWLFCNPIH